MGARPSDRFFGLSFAAFLTILSSVAWFVFDRFFYGALAAAVVFALVALVIPSVLLPFNMVWTATTHQISRVTNALVLGVFYYLVIFPSALIMKLVRFDPLHRRADANATSYWSDVTRHSDCDSLRDTF